MVLLKKIGIKPENNAVKSAAFLFFVISKPIKNAIITMVDANMFGIIFQTSSIGINKWKSARR